jgi:hypothetical protein
MVESIVLCELIDYVVHLICWNNVQENREKVMGN